MSARRKRPPVESRPSAQVQSQPPAWLPSLALPDLAIYLTLLLSILVVYAQLAHFDFINYDDDLYVFNNVHIHDGLSPTGIAWAFTAVVSNNWMPLTLLSHLLDVQLFGLQSGPQHIVNVIFHALASLLLFAVLQRATRARWPSAFVAFVFALHPLHVGSVAWIAERKDVLSTFFLFLALYCYVLYTELPSPRRYLLVAGFFSLGLMSKPMLVTFPFLLLLFDLWPLRRFQWPAIVREKLPLFALSAAASLVTFFVQQSSGAIEQKLSFSTRVANALISYVVYLRQMCWPVRLAIFYPYPPSTPLWQPLAAAAFLLVVSALAVFAWRTRPYFTMGWFWYLGSLVPVIGLVQVGLQSHADRYTYIPMVGILVILSWTADAVLTNWPAARIPIAAVAAISCLALMFDAHAQAAYWQNSETIFQRAIDVTGDNWLAERNLAGYLLEKPGRESDSIPHFDAVRRILPDRADMINNIGANLLEKGRPADAIPFFADAVRIQPTDETRFNLALAHQTLGLQLVKQGRTAEAIPHLETAVRLHPDYTSEYNLGVVLLNVPGRKPDAIVHLTAAQRLHPDPEVAKTLDRLRTTP